MRRRPVGLANARHRERLDVNKELKKYKTKVFLHVFFFKKKIKRDYQQVGDSIAAQELQQVYFIQPKSRALLTLIMYK
jgi:hypothetical protein